MCHFGKVLAGLLFFLSVAGGRLRAAPIEISFLDSENAIQGTLALLSEKGCDQGTTNLFRSVIDWYNASPTDLDCKNFPPLQNGFYSFESTSNLAKALPHSLIYTRHRCELNCFDTVILLAGNRIQTKLQPDDPAGPMLAPFTLTNCVVTPRPAATPRDAFSIIYPAWWGKASQGIFSGAMQDKRICLTAAFDAFCYLPLSTTRQNFQKALLNQLRAGWQREGIAFPTNMEVVICYDAVLDGQSAPHAVSTHTGLLIPHGNQFVFLEKSGSNGPYVRFDFKDRKDLLAWLRMEIEPTTDNGDLLFATINDREIVSLNETGD